MIIQSNLEIMIGQVCFGNGVLSMIWGIYFQIPCEQGVKSFIWLLVLYCTSVMIPIYLAYLKLIILGKHFERLAKRDESFVTDLDFLKKKVQREEVNAAKVNAIAKVQSPLWNEIDSYLNSYPLIDLKAFKSKFTQMFIVVGISSIIYLIVLTVFIVIGRKDRCANKTTDAANKTTDAANKTTPMEAKKHPRSYYCTWPPALVITSAVISLNPYGSGKTDEPESMIAVHR
ncbi:hypothetical protein KSS87_019807 [Heliosperma pusillum]|nr:hypothetical protein KSS87_003044 [Heliosperma pusillum]KAH9607956.1 hypothetical protein KSS87_019807 [Heliosperma pusillum]